MVDVFSWAKSVYDTFRAESGIDRARPSPFQRFLSRLKSERHDLGAQLRPCSLHSLEMLEASHSMLHAHGFVVPPPGISTSRLPRIHQSCLGLLPIYKVICPNTNACVLFASSPVRNIHFKMPGVDSYYVIELFGGAISVCLPKDFADVRYDDQMSKTFVSPLMSFPATYARCQTIRKCTSPRMASRALSLI
jgi:hypothetical protein